MKKTKSFIKKHKNKFILFICLIFGITLGVSAQVAAVIFTSAEVSYNNSNSTLSSTDVQGALDELASKAAVCEAYTPKNYYVSSSGNDSTGQGTIASPYATISKAYQMVEEGKHAVIYLMSNVTVTSTTNLNANKYITLTSCTKSGNNCTYSSNYSVIRGSSLTANVIDQTKGKLTLTNITIDGNNVANSNSLLKTAGESIINSGTTLTKSVSSTASTGTIYGGAINVQNGGHLTINGGTISNSQAALGGGIFGDVGSNIIINGGTISGNTAHDGGGILTRASLTMNGGTITSNTANSGGGGIFSHLNNVNDPFPFVTISGGTISNNTALWGGGILNGYNSDPSNFNKGILNITGGAISGNSSTTSTGTWGGGGILNLGVLNISGGYIISNTAANDGGGIFTNGNITMTGGTIGGSSANKNISSDCGGGIIILKYSSAAPAPTVTISGGSISFNQAKYGGAILNGASSAAATDSTLNIQGTANLSYNTSTTSGGGIYSGARINISGGIISNNTAATYGGGVMVKTQGTFTGGTISNNTATNNNGGGINVDGTFTMSNSNARITNNKAPKGYGGGVCISNTGSFTISAGTITGNTALTGNGVYKFANGTYTKTGGTVQSG